MLQPKLAMSLVSSGGPVDPLPSKSEGELVVRAASG